jgi:hypothetical protein
VARARSSDPRGVKNAILHLATGGCQRRILLKNFPPLLRVQRCFYAWRDSFRHLARDWEKSLESATASIIIVHIHRYTRPIASHCQIA